MPPRFGNGTCIPNGRIGDQEGEKMKKVISVLGIAAAISLSACTKDQNAGTMEAGSSDTATTTSTGTATNAEATTNSSNPSGSSSYGNSNPAGAGNSNSTNGAGSAAGTSGVSH
jgi:hypothetical protein